MKNREKKINEIIKGHINIVKKEQYTYDPRDKSTNLNSVLSNS
jgi:hypothetical protein